MKCPICDSKNEQATNIGRRALAWCATGFTYGLLYPFMRSQGQGPARMIGRNICPRRTYICLDCKHEFTCGPDMQQQTFFTNHY